MQNVCVCPSYVPYSTCFYEKYMTFYTPFFVLHISKLSLCFSCILKGDHVYHEMTCGRVGSDIKMKLILKILPVKVKLHKDNTVDISLQH